MKITGQILKENREKQGLSLHEVSMSTKINVSSLKAMEEGLLEKLPSKAFLRGFVRSYAYYLKLDMTEVLNTFQEEMGTTVPVAEEPTPPPTSVETGRPTWTNTLSLSSKSFAVGIILALIVVIIGIKKVVDRYEQEKFIEPQGAISLVKPLDTAKETSAPTASTAPSLPTAQETLPPQNGASPENITKEAPGAPVSPTPAVQPIPAPTPPVVDKVVENKIEQKIAAMSPEQGKKEESVPSSPVTPAATPPKAIPAPAVVSTPATAPEPKKEQVKEKKNEDVKVAKKEEITDKKTEEKKVEKKEPKLETKIETKKEAQAVPQEVIVEALDTVQIEYTIDGQSSQKITLKPDQIYTLKANRQVQLTVSDGGAINVIHNGQDTGVPGDLGKSKKLKYP